MYIPNVIKLDLYEAFNSVLQKNIRIVHYEICYRNEKRHFPKFGKVS